MRTALLLLLSVCQTSVHGRASVTITPSSSQHVEYDRVTLDCEQLSAGEWTVWRFTTDRVRQCGSGWGKRTSSTCVIESAKPTDTGVYWCQSKHGDSSNAMNITVVKVGSVTLQSPVPPVMDGHDVTLTCEKRKSPNLPADFYKDDSFFGRGPKGYVTIRHFSKSDEGFYRCNISAEESPPSWMLVKDGAEPASLTLSPDYSHHYEYDNLSLSCTYNRSSSQGWKIFRSTTNTTTSAGKISSCGDEWGRLSSFHCILETAKQTDSATYWCQSPARQRSNSLDITVHVADTPVILQSPVLPVMEGDNVTLRCRTKNFSNHTADFYKDDSFIRTEPTGHMTIYNVSLSDEGFYRCNISAGESSPSMLFVRDPDAAAPSSVNSTLFAVIRHLVLLCPYCVSTALMVSAYRKRSSERNQAVSMTTSPTSEDEEGADRPYDDVTTEHHF